MAVRKVGSKDYRTLQLRTGATPFSVGWLTGTSSVLVCQS